MGSRRQSRIIALTHHEKFDGTGYPRGLKGDKIPLAGRITIISDVFDALSSKRVYKAPLPEEEVLCILGEGRGSFFDPDLLDLFFRDIAAMREIQRSYSDREKELDQFKSPERLVIDEQ